MNPQSKLKGMIDLRWEWVQELQDAQEIRAVKVGTDQNIADLLTKPHGRVKYNSLLDQVQQRGAQLAKQLCEVDAESTTAAVHYVQYVTSN